MNNKPFVWDTSLEHLQAIAYQLIKEMEQLQAIGWPTTYHYEKLQGIEYQIAEMERVNEHRIK